VKRKITILCVFILCASLFLTGGKPKLISEDEAKQAGLAFINHIFDVNETEAVVSYQELKGTTFVEGDYQVTGKEQPIYIIVVATDKQADGEYLYYAHVNAETGVAFAAFCNTMFEPKLTPAEQKALDEARKSGNDRLVVYHEILSDCEHASQKWIAEKFDLQAGILGFVEGGGALERSGANANFYIVIRDGTIYHMTVAWPQMIVTEITILNQTRPTVDMP
jgi:hypothetical protein